MSKVLYQTILVNEPHPETNKQLVALKMEYAQELAKITGRPEEHFYCFNNPVNVLAKDENGVLLGFIAVGMVENEQRVYVCHVYVLPSLRGQGVYKLMLARLKKFTKDIGFRYITAGVFKNNRISQKVHSALGFKPALTLYEYDIEKDEDLKTLAT